MRVQEHVEEAITRARRARRQADPEEELAAWDLAWCHCADLAPDSPLVAHVAWKRARALARTGRDPLEAIDPLPDAHLFGGYPFAERGAARLARAHQDRHGYGDARVTRLWELLSTHHLERGDRLGWARARLELAWDATCRGDLTRLDALILEVERADLQEIAVDTWHTALRAATWSEDADRAPEARRNLEDAMAFHPVAAVVEEALLEASVTFGGSAPDYLPDTPFRVAFQGVLRDGRGHGPAMELGRTEGPEWALAVWRAARQQGVSLTELPLADGERLARSSGCLVFTRRAAGSGAPSGGRRTPASRS